MKQAATEPMAFFGLITQHCYDKVLVERQFTDIPCAKQIISKGLGLGIVFGSSVVKAPQIFNIVKKSSAHGVSIPMHVLETFAYTFSTAYNVALGFPFSTWGESLFLTVQDMILVYLLYKYNNKLDDRFRLSSIAFIVFSIFLLSGLSPFWLLTLCQSLVMPMMLFSRLPQIRDNLATKSTGNLSLLTSIMNTGGTAVRVFTTLQEVNDLFILMSWVLGFLLNATILFQIALYWKSSEKKADSPHVELTEVHHHA